MKTQYLLLLLLLLQCFAQAQEFNSYEAPLKTTLYSEALKDSVELEITLPKQLKQQPNTEYPVIYLLDRQLSANYAYNLQTIDYLSTLQSMPKAVVVGITFSRKNRTSWTVPNVSGGKADDLIHFLEKELNQELKTHYPISDHHLLIGHSRTAIFSSYALSKRPEFFNGAIASSVANFDFGDQKQQEQFEVFLKQIASSKHKHYFFFSVGEEAYGDLHESSVDELNTYLTAKQLPENLIWKYYKHQVAHDVTPGVTVANALSQIYKEYGRRVDVCFDLAKESKDKVPWEDFLGLYRSISSDLGFDIRPAELFYNSIASMYYNNYDGIYGEQRLPFTLEILLKAVENYPNDFSYHSWIAEIYFSLNDPKKGEHYLNNAIELVKADKTLSEPDQKQYISELEALREAE